MRVIGIHVHRSFAVAMVLDNEGLHNAGRVELTRDAVIAFGRRLRPDDEVVIEAMVNTGTDRAETATVRASCSDCQPAAGTRDPSRQDQDLQDRCGGTRQAACQWVSAGGLDADEATETLRPTVAQPTQVVQQMTRIKNRLHSVLHANLIPPFEGELFSLTGRAWLETLPLAGDEWIAVRRYLADLDQRAADLEALDQALAERALRDDRARRLMTVGGVHVTVAMGLLAAIGDITRFASPEEKLVSYLGLNLSVRQSGNRAAQHGRIAKRGRSHARGMLVEAAWAAARAPGPLRAFFLRIQSKRGKQVAAVATARKLAVLVWHLLTKQEDYAWARPALLQAKLRKTELAAGEPAAKGRRQGRAHASNSKEVRDRERAWLEQAENAYARFVANWQTKPPPGRTGAANGTRTS